MNKNNLMKIAQELSNLGMPEESEQILDGIVDEESQPVQNDEISFSDISGFDQTKNLVMGIILDMQEHGNLNIQGNDLDSRSEQIFQNYLTQLLQNPDLI